MQIIINIPEEEYTFCKTQWDTECLDPLTIAVKYGMPQKKGQWIVTKKEKITYAECSNCTALYSITEGTYDFSTAKFCPNCGIKMIGREEEK